MSRKDYLLAVKTIQERVASMELSKRERQVIVEVFSDFFMNDNVRFDIQRFRTACNETEE